MVAHTDSIPFANSVKKAVLLTIAYSDQFEYPLTADELYLRLIWRSDEGKMPTSHSVLSALEGLVGDGFLGKSGGFFFLNGRENLVEVRKIRQKYALAQRSELKPLLAFLQKIPWVCGVVLTGSLALNAISASDDSDFLLVIEPKRLWLTRVLVIFCAWMKGKRRSWRSEEENSWCFNLWLDSEHLAMSSQQRSIYTAYEVCQADWLLWRGDIAKQFYGKNSWVKNILPNYWQHKNDFYQSKITKSQFFLRNPLSYLIDGLDYLAFLLQLWYMKPHRTSEKVGRGLAFFHPRDTRSMINSGWHKSIMRMVR